MIDATCSYLLPSMPSREKQTSPMKYMMCVKHLLSWKKQQSFDLTLVSSSLLLIICCQYIYLWISTSYKYVIQETSVITFCFSKQHPRINFAKRVDQTFHRSKKQSIDYFAQFLPVTAMKFDRQLRLDSIEYPPFYLPQDYRLKSSSWNYYLEKSLVDIKDTARLYDV